MPSWPASPRTASPGSRRSRRSTAGRPCATSWPAASRLRGFAAFGDDFVCTKSLRTISGNVLGVTWESRWMQRKSGEPTSARGVEFWIMRDGKIARWDRAQVAWKGAARVRPANARYRLFPRHRNEEVDMLEPLVVAAARRFLDLCTEVFDTRDGARIAELYCEPCVTVRAHRSVIRHWRQSYKLVETAPGWRILCSTIRRRAAARPPGALSRSRCRAPAARRCRPRRSRPRAALRACARPAPVRVSGRPSARRPP